MEAEADGTGRLRVVVALDRDAAARVPDLAAQLRVDDLVVAGWKVSRPRTVEGGGVELEAAKRYRSPAELSQVAEELTGPTGPFRDFRLRRDRSFLRTETAFGGTVDLAGGIEAFGDEALRARLGGVGLGVDPAALERQLGAPLSGVFTFRVVARMPGDEATVWRPALGETLRLEAMAEQWNVRNIGAAAVSLAAAAGLVVVLARRARRRRRRRG